MNEWSIAWRIGSAMRCADMPIHTELSCAWQEGVPETTPDDGE
jgi:hypothetical protein